jgi:sec-independent protein translocase protein TatA
VFLYFSFYFSKKITMILSNLFLAFGPGQIALIVVVALLFFGGKKIPELMKGLGTGIKEFKKGVKEEDTIEESKKDE